MAHDLIKKKVVYLRSTSAAYDSIPVEFPVGLSDAVSLIAIHWHIESLLHTASSVLVMCALSENPEHEIAAPIGVAEFQGNSDLYGMATWVGSFHSSVDGNSVARALGTIVVPLYGMLRPKRQVAVFANISGMLIGMRGEIYYEEETPSHQVVDAISRRYGKYRRT